jgi:methionyl-tRNA synthetase
MALPFLFRQQKKAQFAQAIIDKSHPIIAQNFKDLGIEFDIYHRTSAPIHHETAQEFFKVLNDNGDLEIKSSEQYFDESANVIYR